MNYNKPQNGGWSGVPHSFYIRSNVTGFGVSLSSVSPLCSNLLIFGSEVPGAVGDLGAPVVPLSCHGDGGDLLLATVRVGGLHEGQAASGCGNKYSQSIAPSIASKTNGIYTD